jgi:hypothetical protein
LEVNVPADPYQCREFAYSALAKRAWRPHVRQIFIELAETWAKLAAEIEADQPLLGALSEIQQGGPYETLPSALKSFAGERILKRSPVMSRATRIQGREWTPPPRSESA